MFNANCKIVMDASLHLFVCQTQLCLVSLLLFVDAFSLLLIDKIEVKINVKIRNKNVFTTENDEKKENFANYDLMERYIV